MKVTARQAEAFVKSPPADLVAVLCYGPDAGLSRERARTLVTQAAERFDDPFRVIRLGAEDIRAEPTRLADEMQSQTLLGGRRAIWLEEASDAPIKSIETVLTLTPPPEHLLVLTAGDLGPRVALRVLFERADKAAALPSYADDARSLEALARETLQQAGLSASRSVMQSLVAQLGADRALSRREIEKLVLYKGGPGEVRQEDIDAILADASIEEMDSWLYAVSGGEVAAADAALAALLAAGQPPIRLLNALSTHLFRLYDVASGLARGERLEAQIAALRPPLFWKVKRRLEAQVSRLSPAQFPPLLAKLDDTARALRHQNNSAESLLSQAALAIASRLRRRVERY